MQEIADSIAKAKEDIDLSMQCGMNLATYDDGYLVTNTDQTVKAAENDKGTSQNRFSDA